MKTLFPTAVLLALSASCAAMQPIDCPANIDVRSSASPPPGWQVITPASAHSLERIGFYSGPPSEQASLVPDTTRDGAGKSQDIWTFPTGNEEATWVACYYTGTTMFIAKPVAHGLRNCSVSYATGRSGSRLQLTEAHCE